MKKSIAILTLLICSSLQSFAQTCNPQELDYARQDGERRALEMVRNDMNAEGVSRGSAIGFSPEDCIQRAISRAQTNGYQAIQECNNRSTYFKNCQLMGHRVIQHPTIVLPTRAVGKIDERDITEQECRTRAVRDAERNAIQQCESESGTRCGLTRPANDSSHREERRRRYGIAGPKETYHICEASAEALPLGGSQFRCSVEVFARNRF